MSSSPDAQTLHSCSLPVLAGCSHSVLWEATDTVRDAICTFLEAT